MLNVGDPAPAFVLPDADMAMTDSASLDGKPYVIYFYPKDDTPGCTREACAFRDRSAQLKKLGAVVLGVSPDDTASHAKFRDKYELHFPLLADPGRPHDRNSLRPRGLRSDTAWLPAHARRACGHRWPVRFPGAGP